VPVHRVLAQHPAAEAMGYAQPSISHQVARLERELSAQLFERQARRVTLTPRGRCSCAVVQEYDVAGARGEGW